MKKVLLIGAILVSLSLSVTSAIATELKAVDLVKFSVEPAAEESFNVMPEDSAAYVVKYIHSAGFIETERPLNVTGENTQLTDLMIDEAIELAYKEANLKTAHLVPYEVGWQF